MKKHLLITMPILAGLATSVSAADLISFNYTAGPDDPVHNIDVGDVPFGIIPTDSWINGQAYVGILQETAVNLTTNALSGFTPPAPNGFPGEGWPVYFDTVFRSGLARWGGTEPPNFVLDGLATEFPDGYIVVVYTTGWGGTSLMSALTNQGASVFVANVVHNDPLQLIETTSSDVSAPTEGGNYFVLGTVEEPLTGDTVTVNIGLIPDNGGKVVGGFQVMTPEVFANGGVGGDSWYGYDVDPEGWADTDTWMGWVNVAQDPWVLSLSLDGWLYIPSDQGEGGAWVYKAK
jgi:hypothetical protein